MDVSTEIDSTLLREQLSDFQGLLMLAMLMTQTEDPEKILHLASTSVPSFSRCQVLGAFIDEQWISSSTREVPEATRTALDLALPGLTRAGGELQAPGQAWVKAEPLRSLSTHLGFLVVGADDAAPTAEEQFLLRVLSQETGIALVNARLHANERSNADALRSANETLADTVRALERSTEIHSRFTQVAAAGEGQEGIAQALHELTGFPVAIEDRYGNLQAWAGPDQPQVYSKDSRAGREQMLRRGLRAGRPLREGGRLVSVASPALEVVGVLALVDPEHRAGDPEIMAIEHGATVLAMELARLRSIAETEHRIRRDLVDELLAGTDERSALARGQAIGHDLEKPHRVVVIEGHGRVQDADSFFGAVRRAARLLRAGTLMVTRGDAVILVTEADVDWDELRKATLSELGGGRCRLALGDWAHRPSEFPRSYREAQIALRMQHIGKVDDRVTAYAGLGVYRILAEVNDQESVERFVRAWLEALLEYDERRSADLVATLSKYLQCGGNYDAASSALNVHRSTLKYRLQRIRELSGHNLTDPDTAFNLQLATRAWQTLQALRT